MTLGARRVNLDNDIPHCTIFLNDQNSLFFSFSGKD